MQQTKWANFQLQELFYIVGTKSLDSNAIDFLDNGINFVGRTFEDNGIQGKIKKQDFEPNAPYTITATVIGNYKYVKFQEQPYYCSQNINKLTPKPIISKWNKKIAYFFVANVQKFVSLYNGQQGGYKLDDIKKLVILLPTRNGAIDFAFIEAFISELEKQPLTALDNYLTITGLKNYTLTKEEKEALLDFENGKIEWALYKMDDLFRKVTTKKLPYKAANLPTEPIGENILPCLTASFKKQWLNYFAPTKGATILKNVISLPSNSDVYRAYFQSNDFTVLSDAYAIDWHYNKEHYKAELFLFIVASINRVTDLPIYSYKNKLGGWNVVKNKYIQLPTKDKKPDYNFMQNLVRAIEKLVIKEVVLYAEKKIQATQEVIK